MQPLCRNQQLTRLAGQTFDVLVIGGGATGAGIALDAAARGLNTALIERHDFASGTSSHSSKLIHGGVRYLEAAIRKLDPAQYRLVREALAEREILLKIAPHLVRPLPILLPVYGWFERLQYRSGLWLYDRLARSDRLPASRFLSREETVQALPQLSRDGLQGSIRYHDAQFDDVRMVITLLHTATRQGACVANYLEATGFVEHDGRLAGVQVHDRQSDNRFQIRARVIINASGPQTDHVRRLADPDAEPLLTLSRGSHVVLDGDWTASGHGMLINRTSDDRVLFVLPWQGHTLVGTTDIPATSGQEIRPDPGEVDYLLKHLQQWFEPAPGKEDVRASWAGLRPLPSKRNMPTAGIVREHLLEHGPGGLITITGGKWTTYRKMAEETVDLAVAVARLQPRRSCQTRSLLLAGAEDLDEDLPLQLVRRYRLDEDIIRHLVQSYGSLAWRLLENTDPNDRERLVSGHPYIRAEVNWARNHEMAITTEDILHRRLQLGLLDAEDTRLASEQILQPE